MMNVSFVFIAVALCMFLLACWSVRAGHRPGVLLNMGLALTAVIAAVVLHPIHAASMEQARLEAENKAFNAELIKIKALNSALGSPELTLKYIEQKKTN